MKKRAISALLSLCLLLALAPQPALAAVVATGTISGSITWSLDDSGLLTISGSGTIPDTFVGDFVDTSGTTHTSDIKQVYIGKDIAITSANSAAFSKLPSLTAFSVAADSSSFSVDASGVLYDKTKANLIRCPQALSGSYRLFSSGGLQGIRANAFADCMSLTSVEIPASVTSIGNDAFAHCVSLQTVTFAGSSNLAAVGANAFLGCTALTRITIPASVTSIGNSVFQGCSELANVTFSSPSQLTHIGTHAFLQSAITSITLPNSVTTIGHSAFQDCASLRQVVLPNGIKAIGDSTFSRCGALTSITIPDSVESLGADAFASCSSLTSATLPNNPNFTEIKLNTFTKCSALSSITIPSSVTSIGGNAFDGCSALTAITIPASVTALGQSAFFGCSKLTSVTISNPSQLSTIGIKAFQKCSSLASINLPNTVTKIDNMAFADCSALTSMVIPDSTNTFGENVFQNSGLTSVTIGNGITTPEQIAKVFSGCDKIDSYSVSPGHTAFSAQDGVLFDQSKSTLYRYPADKAGEYTIPSTVTTLSTGAFANCTGLTAVTIPGSVKIIPGNADAGDTSTLPCFHGCSNLETVSLQSGVTTLESRAFSSCDKLSSLEIPVSVNTPGDYLVSSTGPLNVYYHGTSTQWSSLMTPTSNPILKGSTTSVLYSGKATLSASIPGGSTTNPTVVITSDRPFQSGSLSGISLSGTAASGFSGSSSALDPSDSSGKTLRLSLTGSSAGGGDLTVTVPSTCFAGPSGFTQASTVNVDLPDTAVPGPAGYTITLKCIYSTDGSNLSGGDRTESVSGGPYSISLPDASSGGFRPKKVSVTPIGNVPNIADTFTSSPKLNGTATKDQTVTVTYYPTYLLTIQYQYEDGSQAATPYTQEIFEGETYSHSSPAVSGYAPGRATVTGTMPGSNHTETVTYSVSSGGGGGGGGNSGGGGGGGGGSQQTVQPSPTPQPSGFPDLGTSSIQGSVKKEEGIPNWIDRLETPRDALTLYDVMAGRSEGQPSSARGPGVFQREDLYTLPAAGSGGSSHRVEQIEIVDFSLLELFAQGEGALTGTLFTDESFFSVPANAEDRRIDYPNLVPGATVRTANFNGVYVTKIVKDDNFDAKKKETCEYIAAVYHAFDRDCPEIFWLTGKCRVRVMSAKDAATGVTNSYFFLVTADKEGFSMRSPAWAEEGAIQAGIQRRDAAVAQILTTVTSGEVVEQVKQINRWITEHNQYNTSADLTAIDNEPHECLAALEGRIAEAGPVCDGYSKAFKVLCDRLSIPCILETGWARPTAESAGEFHMWSNVKVGENWFGADVTWNDPSVKGFVGAKSGRESEEFLLVGADTLIRQVPFSQSHVVKNQAAVGGVDFNNGPILSSVAFASLPAYSGYYVSLFDDLPVDHWAAEAAAWAKSMGYMLGVSDTDFGPDQSLSRGQLWTILARIAGQDPKSYEELLDWATGTGLTDGTEPRGSADRQQMVTLLYRWAKDQGLTSLPSGEGALEGWKDGEQVAPWAREAMEWAVSGGLISGTAPETLSPQVTVTRAQFAVILQRLFRQGVPSD